MDFIMRLIREEEGVALIEYALIAILIAIALVFTLGLVGETVSEFYQSVADAFP